MGVRCWPHPPLAKTPMGGDIQSVFKVTFKFLSIFSEFNANLSCSWCRVLSLSFWQGLGAQANQGRHPKMMPRNEASLWAERCFSALRTHIVITTDFMSLLFLRNHHLNGFPGFLFRGFGMRACLSGFKEEQIFTAQAQTPINQGSSLKHWQTLHWSGVSRGCSTSVFLRRDS